MVLIFFNFRSAQRGVFVFHPGFQPSVTSARNASSDATANAPVKL
jgi:hypothetical protein